VEFKKKGGHIYYGKGERKEERGQGKGLQDNSREGSDW